MPNLEFPNNPRESCSSDPGEPRRTRRSSDPGDRPEENSSVLSPRRRPTLCRRPQENAPIHFDVPRRTRLFVDPVPSVLDADLMHKQLFASLSPSSRQFSLDPSRIFSKFQNFCTLLPGSGTRPLSSDDQRPEESPPLHKMLARESMTASRSLPS